MADDTGVEPTRVKIFGRTYHLRGEGDSGNLAELAALVDRKMREVARTTGNADTLKVAIMAALNIADDYLAVRRSEVQADDADVERRLARMVTLLDDVLAGQEASP